MTNEEKQLLLKDLCARLPYKTKVFFSIVYDEPVELSLTILRCLERIPSDQNDIVIKPYLRPISSMAKEEDKELRQMFEIELSYLASNEEGHTVKSAASSAFEVDFYNRHHFDYRGLIPMGLALEAPKDMYNKID